jgi:hypothetical protein
LLIQAQLFNVFNRVFYPMPSVAGPTNVSSATAATFTNPFPGSAAGTGALNGGFGFVNTLNGAGTNPRSGQLVARFTFCAGCNKPRASPGNRRALFASLNRPLGMRQFRVVAGSTGAVLTCDD